MRYVIIGNSAAGIGAAEGIRQRDKQGEIIIITHEPHHTYSRPLISYLLLGKVTEETMRYRDEDFYAVNNCTLLRSCAATAIDAQAKCVLLSGGGSVPYDKLLIAAGSSAFVPPIEGLDAVKNAYTFMSLDDAREINAALAKDKRVLIIGAGLIGLKCAEGILDRVADITIIDLQPNILSSILDTEGARLVQKHLEGKGIRFRLSCGVQKFDGNTAVLNNGDSVDSDVRLDFDILVLAMGVRPNTELLRGIAEIGRGIVINERSETSAPDIYAAGDCTQTVDISSGQSKIMALLPNAYMQGECAGINMAGGEGSFAKAIPMNAIGFFGMHLITAGNYTGDVYAAAAGGEYKRLFYSDNALNGYILIGNVDKAGIYTSLIRERTPLDTLDFALICEKPGLIAFTKEDRKVKLGGGTQ